MRQAYLPGYKGRYIVYSDGRVWSTAKRNRKNGAFLRQYITNCGYRDVLLTLDGKKKRMLVHRALAHTFLLNPENKPQVNHINGIKHDNRLENLEWSTRSENIRHADKTGLRNNPKGAANHRAKLTEAKVKTILHCNLRNRDLARFFDVSESTISDIRKRKAWSHVS